MGGGLGVRVEKRPVDPCGPGLRRAVTPLRWSNKGFLQSGMLGCLDARMPRGVSGLEGFGDAGLEGIGDCSCKLARSSSGRGRRITKFLGYVENESASLGYANTFCALGGDIPSTKKHLSRLKTIYVAFGEHPAAGGLYISF